MEKIKINFENNIINNILPLKELSSFLIKDLNINLSNNVFNNGSNNNNNNNSNSGSRPTANSKQKQFTINFNSTQSFLYSNLETNFTDITPTGVVAGTTTVTNSDVVSASVLVATTSSNTTGSSVNSDHHVVIIDWKEILIVSLLCLLIVITVIGNTLVILAVITTRRLRTVTNCFVMSLAIADWLVGIFVMPPAIPLHIMGSWQLGWILCDIWISLDVLLCTASILSLCAISIDRYLAVTQPLNYSRRRRSKRLALLMILVVWILALAITCPPILGWYEPGRNDSGECRYNQNEGYVVFSAMGSFFIPMAVMIYVYLRISCVVAARHDEMTEIEVHKKTTRSRECDLDAELDQDVSEQEPSSPRKNVRNNPLPSALTTALSKTTNDSSPNDIDLDSMNHETSEKIVNNNKNGHYELVHTPSMKRNVTVTYKQQSVDKWSNSSANYNQNHHHHHQHHQHQHPNHHHQHHHSGKSSNSTDCCVTKNVRVHQKSLSNRISSLKRESKTTQTLSIVVGGFIACWLPFFINYLITPFIPTDYVNSVFQYLILWLGWINSAINPFIYAFYSVDFRAAFWRLTFRRFFKATRKPPYTSNTVSIRR